MPEFVFDHVHLRSADADAAARFYVETFGAAETARVMRDTGLRVQLSLAGMRVLIDTLPADAPAAPKPQHLGLEHFCLRVADLAATLAELRARGVTVVTDLYAPRPGLKIAFVAAPDGVEIELLETA